MWLFIVRVLYYFNWREEKKEREKLLYAFIFNFSRDSRVFSGVTADFLFKSPLINVQIIIPTDCSQVLVPRSPWVQRCTFLHRSFHVPSHRPQPIIKAEVYMWLSSEDQGACSSITRCCSCGRERRVLLTQYTRGETEPKNSHKQPVTQSGGVTAEPCDPCKGSWEI